MHIKSEVVDSANSAWPVVDSANSAWPVVDNANSAWPVDDNANSAWPIVDSAKPALPVANSAKPALPVANSAKPAWPVVDSAKPAWPVVDSAKPALPVVENANSSWPVVDNANSAWPVVDNSDAWPVSQAQNQWGEPPTALSLAPPPTFSSAPSSTEVVAVPEKSPVKPSKILFINGIEDQKNKLPLLSVEEISLILLTLVDSNISIVDVTRRKQRMRINHHAIVELGSVEEAQKAIEKLDGITLDTKHRLTRDEKRQKDERNAVAQEEDLPVEGEKFGASVEGLNELTTAASAAVDSQLPVKGEVNELTTAASVAVDSQLPVKGEVNELTTVASAAVDSQLPVKGEVDELTTATSAAVDEIEVYSSCSSGDLALVGGEDEVIDESDDDLAFIV
uniref:RRM domain-containing protein n=1 Tax=Globodera pallida TaxID=36090 RepID=A0A183BWS7_GLOPA